MRITTTSSFAIAAALSLAFGTVQPAAAQNARIAAAPIAPGAVRVVNPDSMMPTISRTLSTSSGEISRNAAASVPDIPGTSVAMPPPLAPNPFENSGYIPGITPDDIAKADNSLPGPNDPMVIGLIEEIPDVSNNSGSMNRTTSTGGMRTYAKTSPDLPEIRDIRDFNPRVRIFKVVPDNDPGHELVVLEKKPNGPRPKHGTHTQPRKPQPFGKPEIIIVDIPGPRVNRGAPTETAGLASPCFAAGVIVSTSGGYENSDAEEFTDASEISCNGSFPSPTTLTAVASAR